MVKEFCWWLFWLFNLLLFSASLAIGGEPVRLAWSLTFTNHPDIAGVRLYYGGQSGIYSNVVTLGQTNCTQIVNLWAGRTYYFAATSFTTNGVESEFSNEVIGTVKPAAPHMEQNSVTLEWGPFDVHQSTNLLQWTVQTVPGFLVLTQEMQGFYFVTRAGDTNRQPASIRLSP